MNKEESKDIICILTVATTFREEFSALLSHVCGYLSTMKQIIFINHNLPTTHEEI